ncbi:MAG: DUF6586 family protein [Halopseudomonas sp.]|uniref:DUF6586 family protein n=1 Tax=Halopseudomonas sp. TaxID=2901191 RepID=UPI003002910E
MANEVYTRTNQALFFARKALDAWSEAQASDALDALSQVQYHREHALFHLYRGVLAVVHEVADRYRWPLVDLRQVEAALSPAVVARFPGPELAELTELAENADTWLAKLLAAWQQLQAPPLPETAAPTLIASSAVRRGEWTLEDGQEGCSALSERVRSYRQGMMEW